MSAERRDPAFLAYATDWLQSETVSGMTLEQQGAYWRLLCFGWLHDGIPADLERLRSMLGSPPRRRFEALWAVVGPCWEPHPTVPGRLVNPRQEHERAARRAKSAEMARRGLAGNESRWSGNGRSGVAQEVLQ